MLRIETTQTTDPARFGKLTRQKALPTNPFEPSALLSLQPATDEWMARAVKKHMRFGTADTALLSSSPAPAEPPRFAVEPGPMAKLRQQGVLICGADGLMGNDILKRAYQAGFNPVASDIDELSGRRAIEKVQQALAEALGRKIIKKPQFDEIVKTTSPRWVDGGKIDRGEYTKTDFPQVGVVIEAIPENPAMKNKLFRNVEPLVPDDTLILSNTSSESLDRMSQGMRRPERVAGFHAFQPAHKNRLMEVVKATKTSEETMDKAMNFARANGYVPVRIEKDSPAFVANRMLFAIGMEGLRLYEEGWGSPDEIDKAASKILWPDFVKVKAAREQLAPPFKMFKKFQNLAHEVANNLRPLGAFYEPPEIFKKEYERIHGNAAWVKAARGGVQHHDLEQLTAFNQVTDDEMRGPFSQLEQTQQTSGINGMRARGKQLRKELAELEAENGLFSQGFPPVAPPKGTTPKDRQKMIEDRLYGVYYGLALQMAQGEKLCRPEDVDTIARVGFDFNIGPFESMHQRGPEKTAAALKAVKDRYGDAFPIPETTEPPKLSWVNTKVRPDGVAEITVDRTQMLFIKKNSNTLGSETLKAIAHSVREADADSRVKAIVLQSNGGKLFSGGANLDEIKGKSPKEVWEYIQLGRETMDTIANASKPTIAKVQGDAFGGGVELALACDRIVAAQNATLTLPEVNLGIVPAWGGTERLAHKVGKPLAKALILNGTSVMGITKGMPKPVVNYINNRLKWDIDRIGYRLDMKTAQKVGLVDVVVHRGDLDDAVNQLVKQPAFLEKPDPKRGLSRTIDDYPVDVRDAYRLDTIEEESKKAAGRFSQAGWALANKLINAAGTVDEGKIEPHEANAILKQATTKRRKVEALVNMGIEYQGNSRPVYGTYLLGKALVADSRTPWELTKMTVGGVLGLPLLLVPRGIRKMFRPSPSRPQQPASGKPRSNP